MTSGNVKEKWVFFRFISGKNQLRDILLFLLAYFLVFVLIKVSYPFPDTFPDTGDYVGCALYNTINCYRPIGYSWFLTFFKAISDRIQSVFILQFIINALATLYLLFTIKFFLPPRRPWLFRVFAFLVILCPTTLYLTNVMMSDTIFISLTLVWFASALWLIYRMKISVLLFHLLALYLLIQVRYTALFYPLFSATILFIRWKIPGKILWIAPLVALTLVIFHTRKEFEENFGIASFSAFSGWQLANNAIHIIPFIDLEPSDLKDNDLKYIHDRVQKQDTEVYPQNSISSIFMWDNSLALKSICREMRKDQKIPKYATAWIYLGDYYGKYGRTLIMKHPFKYFRHFIWYNMKLAAYPEPELFSSFRAYKPDKPLTDFYTLGNKEFTPRWDYFNKLIKPLLAPGTLIVWILLLALIIFTIVRRKHFHFTKTARGIAFLLISFLLIYLGFHLLTTPIALRYLTAIAFAKLGIAYVFLNSYSTAYPVR